MLWYCAENSIDDIGMFLLLLKSIYTGPRPFLLLTPPMRRLGVHKKLGGGQYDLRDIPYCMTSCSVYRSGGEGKGGCSK